MTQIRLNNHDYQLSYNLQSAIAYERITGNNPFDLKQFAEGKIEPTIALLYAMLLTNNDSSTVPDMDELLQSVTNFETIALIDKAVATELSLFFKVEAGDKVENAPAGEESKN